MTGVSPLSQVSFIADILTYRGDPTLELTLRIRQYGGEITRDKQLTLILLAMTIPSYTGARVSQQRI